MWEEGRLKRCGGGGGLRRCGGGERVEEVGKGLKINGRREAGCRKGLKVCEKGGGGGWGGGCNWMWKGGKGG